MLACEITAITVQRVMPPDQSTDHNNAALTGNNAIATATADDVDSQKPLKTGSVCAANV